jgi:hypothetical protein
MSEERIGTFAIFISAYSRGGVKPPAPEATTTLSEDYCFASELSDDVFFSASGV